MIKEIPRYLLMAEKTNGWPLIHSPSILTKETKGGHHLADGGLGPHILSKGDLPQETRSQCGNLRAGYLERSACGDGDRCA